MGTGFVLNSLALPYLVATNTKNGAKDKLTITIRMFKKIFIRWF